MKFILIVMVIYCHMINVGFAVPWNVYQIIYSFHMPLFVFISGFFTNKDKPGLKYWDLTLNFAWLFVLFNIISIGVYIYVCDEPPVKFPYIPAFALWYLLCMVYWRSLIWIIPNKILKSKFFFVGVLSISVLPSIINVNYFALSRCLSFAPYFLLGWYLRNIDMVTVVNRLKKWQKYVIVIISLICCLVATKIPIGIFWGHEPVGMEIHKIIIYKGIAWIIAIFNSIALFIIIPNSFIISEGRHTLTYYLFHTLLLYPVLYYCSKLLPHNYLITVLMLLLILSILAIIRRIGFVNTLLRIKPIEIYHNIANRLIY